MRTATAPQAPAKRQPSEQRATLARRLEQLQGEGFFGTVKLNLEDGQIVRVTEERSYRLADLP